MHKQLLFYFLVATVAAYNSNQNHVPHSGLLPFRDNMNASYGQLARILMIPAFTQMNKNMPTLNASSLPPDVKLLRNNLLAVRNILDVFAFAYPVVGQHDIFIIAREDINQGYTWIGNFKDLSDSHVNYTYTEMVALRNKCLSWQDTYFGHLKKYDYSNYFVTPSTTQLFVRVSSDLSPFFWGASDNLQPKLTWTGYQNIAYLMRNLTAEAVAKYGMFCNLTHVYENTTQLVFHGYRKLIRGIDSVSTFAVEIYRPNTTCVSAAIAETTQLYSSIGKIEDQIAAYNFYVKHNQMNKAAQQEGVVDSMFATLKGWMTQTHPDASLCCLEASLISL
jgi:hypothetical protein